jgi:hypothetical protein
MSVSGVAVGYRAFRLPRQGHDLDECQDALAGDLERGRFAIADGVAESPHAALWARLLVEEFVRRDERLPEWASWLPSIQQRWAERVGRPTDALTWLTQPAEAGVPWYLEPGLLHGAFATFLGLVIEETSWHALAVGDSCLFQVRRDALVRTFPIAHAADFSNAPWLVGSRTSPGEVPYKNGRFEQGDWQPHDRFWLMTDALAQWFLGEIEAGGQPWLALDPLIHPAAAEEDARQGFAAWIERLRAARQLRNDDVTLLAVRL